ncbi:MAG: GatB/YqeY domain-containing protein [Bacteroidales bacterium]|mgnify:CR=1 FL=1|nr:GatB/YqeY domain-containing protein [Bacteroidales bacterium]
MTIEEQINSGIKDAMKAKDKAKLDALRNVKKLILEAKTAPGAGDTITDEKCIQLIQKLVKQGEDSASIYKEQNRADLYDAEMAQVEVLRVFLPKQLTEEELTEALKTIIAEVGASSMKDLGKVMGTATKQLAGKADGKAISAKVKELLQ